VDDEVSVRLALETLIRKRGYRYASAQSEREAKELIAGHEYDMVITDMKMESPDSGVEVVRAARAKNPRTPVLVITGYADVESAVNAMKAGAYEFIEKPFQIDEIEAIIEQAMRRGRRAAGDLAPSGGKESQRFEGIIGKDKALLDLFKTIENISDTDVTTLITGETGTGKELVARAIHRSSVRSGKNFVAVNCGAIPESLIEAELFGSRKGSYTGASHDRPGRFQVADGGTIFLDEIGDMAPHMQVKLLRVLAEGEVQPIGAQYPSTVDVRVVAATHQNLDQLVLDNKFRADLFYRLNVIHLDIPSLRERPGDIVELALHFVRRFNRSQRRAVSGISPAAQEALTAYGWPGNVRELENAIERVVVLKREGLIEPEDLPSKVQAGGAKKREGLTFDIRYVDGDVAVLLAPSVDHSGPPAADEGPPAGKSRVPAAPAPAVSSVAVPTSVAAVPGLDLHLPHAGVDLRQFIEGVEYSLIDQALERCEGNKSKAAQLLGLNRTTLVERLKKRERRSG
jgi:DNA-binding NtrC family response regulator